MEQRVCVRYLLAGLALCLMQGAEALAADAAAAQRWMERVLEAGRRVHYEGTFVYRRGAQVETLRLVHRAGEDAVSEKLTALSGPPREIVRRGDSILYVVPEGHPELLEHAHTKGLHRAVTAPSLNVAHLQRHYDFAVAGESRIAGRPVVVLAVRPQDPHRYGYRLWVDRESGLVLRSDLLNAQGRVLEQVVFTDLRLLPEVPPERLEPTLDGQRMQRHYRQTDATPPAAGAWEAGWVPPGFVKRAHARRPMTDDGPPVEHLVFEDGLARVSVYVEEKREGHQTPLQGAMQLGALNAFGRDAGTHSVVVVGDLPPAAVERIARSVAPRTDGEAAP